MKCIDIHEVPWIGTSNSTLSIIFLLLGLILQNQQDKVPEVVSQDFLSSGTVGRAPGSAQPLTNSNVGKYPQLWWPMSWPTLLG